MTRPLGNVVFTPIYQAFVAAEYPDDPEAEPLLKTYWLAESPAELLANLNGIPRSFSLIAGAPVAGDLQGLWYEHFGALIRLGLRYFLAFGPRAEELHDLCDSADLSVDWEARNQAGDILMTTWHDHLGEALEYNELCVHCSHSGEPIEHTLVVV